MATTRKERRAVNPDLLRALYECRYMTAAHVHRALPAQYQNKTERTARNHLNGLEQLGYLKPRQLAKDTPKIYSPKPTRFHHLLRQHYPDTTFHQTREETTKDDKLNHELAITDIQIDISRAADNHPNLTVLDQQRRYFHKPNRLTYQDEKGIDRHLEPDLGELLSITGPKTTFPLLHYIEMDMGNESPTVITKKIAAYPLWFEQTGEQYLLDLYRTHQSPNPRPAFRLLIVTRARRSNSRDLNRVNQIYHTAQQLPDQLRKQTFFSTNQAVLLARPHHAILTSPIWYPVLANRGKPRALFN